jgi:hypothetical protein
MIRRLLDAYAELHERDSAARSNKRRKASRSSSA